MRNKPIDLLRWVGLSLIILAHVNPPARLFQLRNFDVPLMVLVSGMAFAHSSALPGQYLPYIWKRFVRLAFPVWFFLTGYFLSVYFFRLPIETLTPGLILTSYTFISGIGYVWIFRVFLLTALAAPLIAHSSRKIDTNHHYLLILLVLYVGYEVGLSITRPMLTTELGRLLAEFGYEGIAYALIFALGFRMPRLSFKLSLAVFALTLVVFGGLGLFFVSQTGKFVYTQLYKYPPSVYYVAYALTASLVTWWLAPLLEKIVARFEHLEAVVLFLARNSIWVYLWHIPLIKVLETYFTANYLVAYGLVYGCATFLTYGQVLVVDHLILPRIANERIRHTIKIVLAG